MKFAIFFNRLLLVSCLLLTALRVGLEGAPAITIYNQNFAVVRESIQLDLQKGINRIEFSEITAHLEPASVVLRDLSGKRALRILEQNYRSDPLDQNLLLAQFEGKTIPFEIRFPDRVELIEGRIVRAPYVLHQAGISRYDHRYASTQMARAHGAGNLPIVEIDGRLRFGLPGTPLFPHLGNENILKPTLYWLLASDAAGEAEAELSYLTGGMSWEAAYNLVAPEEGDVVDLIGWVTMDNQSGRAFQEAAIKLLAGDVHRVRPEDGRREIGLVARAEAADFAEAAATHRAFDEYHMYDLTRPVTLRDRETKQVEFVRAQGVRSKRTYVYDGAAIDLNRYRNWDPASLRQQQDLGTESQPKVWIVREFENTTENGLGIPLPRGITRFYRQDNDGRLEFTGENTIDHTPRNESIRIYTGNAFDLVGERRRTDYRIDTSRRWLRESFELRLRNRKENEAVIIHARESLYRWQTWEIEQASHPFEKKSSQQIEFAIEVEPDTEKVVTYTVHYSW
jgi:hypothetical protein